jgi:hypothetical protein
MPELVVEFSSSAYLTDTPLSRFKPIPFVPYSAVQYSASIMASAIPFCFCATQKHIAVEITSV